MTGNSSRTIRVLAYADSRIFSGAESLLCEIVAGLASDPGIEVVVAAPGDNPGLRDGLMAAAGRDDFIDVPVQPIPVGAVFLHEPRRKRAIRRALGGLDVDVVLLNLPSAEYGPSPLAAGVPEGVPVVGLLHISGTMANLDFKLGGLRTWVARKQMKKLNRVCLISEAASHSFAGDWDAAGVARDIIRMPRPKVERQERTASRLKFGFPEGRTIVGVVGRLTARQKGHDTLIEAAPAVIEAHPEVEFAVAGEGQDRELLGEMARQMGVEDHFTWLGQVGDIESLLSAIDLIVIPSRFEGLPLIALEALEIGVPGVASGVDGLLDVWPAEWRVPPNQPDALAKGLIGLVEADSGRKSELLESGRKMMKGRVDERAADQVAASLRRAVNDD